MTYDPRDRQPIPVIPDDKPTARVDAGHQLEITLGGSSDGRSGALHDDNSGRPTSRTNRGSRSSRSHRPSLPSGPGNARGDAGCSSEGGRTQRVTRAADNARATAAIKAYDERRKSGLSREAANPSLGPLHGVLHTRLDARAIDAAKKTSQWTRLEAARNLLAGSMFNRQSKCHHVRRVGADEDVVLHRHESGSYTVQGLVRCGHMTCPCCGPVRARQTAAALAVAFKRHLTAPPVVRLADPTHVPQHANDRAPQIVVEREPFLHDVWMLTLTMPHRADEATSDVVDRLFRASEQLWRSPAWRRFSKRWGIVARVRVLDVTFGGANGIHPHFHVALFVTQAAVQTVTIRPLVAGEDALSFTPLIATDVATRAQFLDGIREVLIDSWADALRDAGTRIDNDAEFRRVSLMLTPSEHAAAYFTKWGLADEIGATTAKSRNHLRLLDAVRAGVDAAGDAFIAWRHACDGKQWVSGLTDACRVYAVTGEDVSAHVEQLRAKRDAELTRKGQAPVKVRPLRIAIRPHLYAGALAAMRPTFDDGPDAPTGWGRLFAFIDATDARGGDVQLEFEGELWRARVYAKRERYEDFMHRTGAAPTEFSSSTGDS
jgi:hypothetical protein